MRRNALSSVFTGSSRRLPGRSITVPLLLGAALAVSPAVYADQIFKCRDHGRTLYTSDPEQSASCRSLDLEIREPSVQELARAAQERARQAAEERQEAEENRADRMVRVRELEALAQLRTARAAELEARARTSCRQHSGQTPCYFPTYYSPTIACPFVSAGRESGLDCNAWNGKWYPVW